MSDFLTSLKSDLLDRRFLPVLALLGVALLGALAYAVLGGGSATSSTPTPTSPVTSASSGATGAVAISQASPPNKAVSETTSGAHSSTSTPRNPFTPLPTAKHASTTASSAKPSPAASSTGGASASHPSSGSSSQPAPTQSRSQSTPAKPQVKHAVIHYHVSAAFGLVPPAAPGAPPAPAQLKTYADMALDEPLPSKDNPQLVFLGVILSTGKDAVFALTGEAILHGSAVCKPSPSQCQAIALAVGKSETLEVVEANGQPATYELKLLSIAKSLTSGSAARAGGSGGAGGGASAFAAVSRSGRALLGHDGVPTLAQLRYAPRGGGGLLQATGRPFAARAARHRR